MGLFERRGEASGTNSFGKPKLPPGQTATSKFQVLTYGETPRITTSRWRLSTRGCVEEEQEWTWTKS